MNYEKNAPNRNTIYCDLELLKKAMYTDPKDQSPWNYHYWIINNFSPMIPQK